MTFANSPYVLYARPTTLSSLAKRCRQWRDQRRLARAQRKFPELPVCLLRDVGLENLRDLKADPTFRHRML